MVITPDGMATDKTKFPSMMWNHMVFISLTEKYSEVSTIWIICNELNIISNTYGDILTFLRLSKVFILFSNIGHCPTLKWYAVIGVGGIYPSMVDWYFLPYTIPILSDQIIVHLNRHSNVLKSFR